MKELTADQENEQLQEGGPPLWWCRRFCCACNGYPERRFWCGAAFHGEPCSWTLLECLQEIKRWEEKRARNKAQKKEDKEEKQLAKKKKPQRRRLI